MKKKAWTLEEAHILIQSLLEEQEHKVIPLHPTREEQREDPPVEEVACEG